MAKYKIVKYGDNILREKLKPVDFNTLEPILDTLIKDMIAVCNSVGGVGLSANQIGLLHRLAIILMPDGKDEKKKKLYVIINPKIVASEGCITDEEGCLSLPGLYVDIDRAKLVKVHCLNEKGLPVEITATGLLAKALQHEIDHLDGKIFIDHADPKLKPQIKKALKNLATKWK